MSILPGWSSLESTANWVWGFHVAGLVFILLLAASEILAFIYGKRADTLRDIAESVRAEKRQQEINEANAFHAAEVEALKREMGQAERKPGAFQREPTDRQLSPAQGNALIQALSPFRGQKIRVVCGVNDVEACRFAEAFKAVFVAAGWNCDGVTQAAYIGSHPLGIEVTVNQAEGQAGRIPQPADRLMKALIVLGLSGQEIFADPAVPARQIDFRVGRKPAAKTTPERNQTSIPFAPGKGRDDRVERSGSGVGEG